MLKKFVIALAAIVAIFVIAVALQPADFRVERTTTIAAPQVDVFAKVNDSINGMPGLPGPSSILIRKSLSKAQTQAKAR